MTDRPNADVSARLAWADDAAAIAGVQVRAWQVMYADLVPPDVLPQDAEVVAPGWQQLLSRPADARARVLVALERNRVTGFVLTSSASDPDADPVADGELSDLTLDPGERGKGHGSRLLQAAVDTLTADKFTRAVTWVIASDDQQRAFFTEAGWAPDGAHRELDLDGSGTTIVKQVRLHTALV